MVNKLSSFLNILYNQSHLYYSPKDIIFIKLSMANIFGGLFSRVLRIRIDGSINQKMSDNISVGLRKAFYVKPEAVMVAINSPGGSLTQAKNISDILRQYSNRNNTPIYTFAEDQCLGSANVILTSGAKCYANSMSMIGDIGYMWSSLWFQKFAQKYNIKQQFVTAGENKVKFNKFQQIKPESQKWMKNYLYMLEHDLQVNIINNREVHFTKLKLDQKALEQNIFKKGIIASQQAQRLGLIDGIMNMDDLMNQRFSGTKIHEVAKQGKLSKLKQGMQKLGLQF